MKSADEAKSQDKGGSEALEWIVAAIAGIAVAFVFVFLCYEALTASGTAALLNARAVSFQEDQGLHYVLVSVSNHGGEAAADANVIGRITVGGIEHTATALLDYAPSNSSSEVTLVFDVPIEPQGLHVLVEGFRAP